jgi:hypothetical protein
VGADAADSEPGHTHLLASQMRSSLQSRSDVHPAGATTCGRAAQLARAREATKKAGASEAAKRDATGRCGVPLGVKVGDRFTVARYAPGKAALSQALRFRPGKRTLDLVRSLSLSNGTSPRRLVGFGCHAPLARLALAAVVLTLSACQDLPRRALAMPQSPTGALAAEVVVARTSAPLVVPVRTPTARHVIIVSEDGMRPDALVRARAPFHERLMREGAFSLTALTIRNASTLPSHAAMLSGFDVHDHGLHWNSWRPERGFIKVPTVLDAAREAGNGSAAFVGKKKLAHVVRPGVVDVFARPGYLCRKIVKVATEYFLEHRPQVEFVHFSDPDSKGHKNGWMSEAQMEAIRAVDRCLAEMFDAIAASDLAKDTLFIVSSDHGGHGHGHSGRHPEDRLIPWFAFGVGVRTGHKIEAQVSTLDTAATTLWALGLAAPAGLAGRPVAEAFHAAATDL